MKVDDHEMNMAFRLFLEKASDFMHITDRKGNIIYANEAMVKALGYTREELNGMHITNLLHEDYRREILKEKLKELIQKGSFSLETIWIGKNLEKFYGEAKVVAIFDENRNFLVANTVFHDLTKRKEINDRLRKREEELSSKSKSLEEINTALKVLLEHTEKEKKEIEGKITFNIKEMVLPHVYKLKRTALSPIQCSCLREIENSLEEILTPFKRKLSLMNISLTPKEILVATHVKNGRSSKEIADILNLSFKTIEYHRSIIRKKFKLTKKKTNLQAFLGTLAE